MIAPLNTCMSAPRKTNFQLPLHVAAVAGLVALHAALGFLRFLRGVLPQFGQRYRAVRGLLLRSLTWSAAGLRDFSLGQRSIEADFRICHALPRWVYRVPQFL